MEYPIIFHVDQLRDGKSYATRSVKAVQQGKAIFVLLASFQVPEPRQPTFQINFDMSKVPPPEECETTEAKLERGIEERGMEMSQKMREYLERELQERKASAIEIRNVAKGYEEFNQSST